MDREFAKRAALLPGSGSLRMRPALTFMATPTGVNDAPKHARAKE